MPKILKKATLSTRKLDNLKTGKESKKLASQSTSRPVSKLSIPVYSLLGNSAGTLSLPKEIFGKEINKKLLAQAMRVYMTNRKSLPGNTKTRGEVEGSTAKIYNQKGTGRARHGGVRAPIFVGGGIAFGPQSRKVRLELPQKMRKAALYVAMSEKLSDKKIIGFSGLEKATGKTKEMSHLLKKINVSSALIVTGEKQDNIARGFKNISGIIVLPANLINTYEVLKHNMLILTKEGLAKLENPIEKEAK